jgi:DNA-binding YbaB/EbfC family protein
MAKFSMADQFNLIQKVQKVQKEIEKLQGELEKMEVEGSSGGGMVTVTANGKQKIISITIDPEVITPDDREMMEDLIVAAVNQALEKSRELAQEEMQKITGDMLGGLPGGLKIPGFGL